MPNFELLYFNSYAPLGTFQGVYPTAAPNQSERDVIMNPIAFSTDNTGVSVPHLDFTTMIHPYGRLEWKLFDKVWAIPELCRIRKFPHRFTFLYFCRLESCEIQFDPKGTNISRYRPFCIWVFPWSMHSIVRLSLIVLHTFLHLSELMLEYSRSRAEQVSW